MIGEQPDKKVRTKSFTLLLIKAKAVLHLSMFQDFWTVGGSGSEILIRIRIREHRIKQKSILYPIVSKDFTLPGDMCDIRVTQLMGQSTPK